MGEGTQRREIPQRSTGWATRTADAMASVGLTPNQVSIGSVVAALAGASALIASAQVGDGARAALLVVAALCMPLRLLLNMLDGMLAVEKGMHSPLGDLYNELPDRIADVLFLGAAGVAAAGVASVGGPGGVDLGLALGAVAAVLALFTAYIRTLGASLGVGNHFAGPLAKPARMWVLGATCLVASVEPWLPWSTGSALLVGLGVIALGSLVTCVRRLRLIARDLRQADGEAA